MKKAIYTIYSFTCFLVLALYLTLEGFWLITIKGRTEANKMEFHRRMQQLAWFVINHIPGTSFEYVNSVGETFDKPSIIISNHQSHLDLMAIIMLTPKLVVLTKKWVWHNPFYGLVIRYADYMPVDDNPNLMSQIEDRLENGYSIMIFPEGTRSIDCRIGRFHRGAFKIAEDHRLDIVPIFISGFGKVLPKTSFHLHHGKMRLEVLPRFHSNDELWKKGGYRDVSRMLHLTYLRKNEEMHNNR